MDASHDDFIARLASDERLEAAELATSYPPQPSLQEWWPNAAWTAVDVDRLAEDGAVDGSGLAGAFQLVVCNEVLERCPSWRPVVAGAARLLAPKGRLVVMCAGPARRPSAAAEGDCYEHVSSSELAAALLAAGLRLGVVVQAATDARAVGIRP